MNQAKLQIYDNETIRTAWDEENEEWYFSIVDVVGVLTESADPPAYWRKLKQRLKEEGNQSVTNCHGLRMLAADGKRRLTDVANTEQLLHLIQFIPSKKTESFKQWLSVLEQGSPENGIIPSNGTILLYSYEGSNEYIDVYFRDDSFWMTQSSMAQLFDCSADNISSHLGNIYEEGELERGATTEKISVVRQEGNRQVNRILDFYNLDAIIAVGYRINSKKATRFRQWATKTLREYIQKGFVINDELMKNGRQFGRDYFDELLERIREIRASERRAYQKIADIFEQCSYDYDKNSETTKAFYAFVQNKLHYAVTGKTAAELISERATLDSPTMGLTTWKGAPEGKILKSDALVAKNYLNEKEIARLNRLVTMFIDYAELMAEDEQLMSMKDWLAETDRFLTNNRRNILAGKGHISHEEAVQKVSEIYTEFRKKQDADYISEFDKETARYLKGE